MKTSTSSVAWRDPFLRPLLTLSPHSFSHPTWGSGGVSGTTMQGSEVLQTQLCENNKKQFLLRQRRKRVKIIQIPTANTNRAASPVSWTEARHGVYEPHIQLSRNSIYEIYRRRYGLFFHVIRECLLSHLLIAVFQVLFLFLLLFFISSPSSFFLTASFQTSNASLPPLCLSTYLPACLFIYVTI